MALAAGMVPAQREERILITATQRNGMVAGTTLVARYKGTRYTTEVITGDDGRLRYRLADGREFTSPSAAGSAVMGGPACNGWRFWSVRGTEPEAEEVTPEPKKRSGRAKTTRTEEVSAEKTEEATS